MYDKNSSDRKAVLNVLTARPMTVSEVAAALGRSRNGHLVDTMKDLVQAGFLAEERGINPKTGELRQEIRYRICDNYARFYLKYVEPNIEEIKDGKFEFEQIPELKNWQTIMGLAFENLVLNHVLDFKDALHLGGTHLARRLFWVAMSGLYTFLL